MLLSTFTGNATLPDCSAQVLAFYRKTVEGRQQPLHIAFRDPGSGVKLNNTDNVMAGIGNTNFGYWNRNVYDMPEGAIISIMAKKRPVGWTGFGYQTANIVIRLRSQAALRSLRIDLPFSTKANVTAGYFEGRFDVITAPLAEMLKFGLDLRAPHLFDANAQSALFDVSVIEKEISPLEIARKEVITTVSGKEVEVVKARRTRVIRMRKPGE